MAVPEPSPPRLAAWLFDLLLAPQHDAVLGDLEEEFHDHAEAYGRARAALLYWGQLFTTVPSFIVSALVWRSIMIGNYLKIALRTLVKQKGFSALNIVGLAVSLSLCLLFILFVQDQRSYDRFHEHADRIYRSSGCWRASTYPRSARCGC